MGNAENKRHLASIADTEIDKAFDSRTRTGDPNDLRRFETDFDKIQKSYHDPSYELPQKLEVQRDRWLWARQLKDDDPGVRSNRELAKRLMQQFGISQTTAYSDIKNMQRLFATLDQIDTDFEWMLLFENAKKELHKASELGVKGQKTIPALIKELRELMKLQADKDNSVEPTVVNIQIVDNPELVGGRRIPNLKAKVEAEIARAKAAAEKRFEDVNFEEL